MCVCACVQPQNGVTPVGSQMIQMGQNNNIANNGWSGMIANPNIQPAPGSNPFFNLPTQTPAAPSPFMSQVSNIFYL